MTRRREKPSRPAGLWLLAWAVPGLAIPLTAPKLLVFALAHVSAARAGAAPH